VTALAPSLPSPPEKCPAKGYTPSECVPHHTSSKCILKALHGEWDSLTDRAKRDMKYKNLDFLRVVMISLILLIRSTGPWQLNMHKKHAQWSAFNFSS